MNKNRLTIGEFSNFCGVTVKTLRHYEKMKLLLPAEVDDYSGYRYYNLAQFQRMQTILRFKALGFSLEEIGDLMAQDSAMPTATVLQQKIAQTQLQMSELQERLSSLQSFLDSHTKIKNMENYSIEALPSIIVASYRGTIPSYDSLGNVLVNVVAPEMQRLGCRCTEPGYCFTSEMNAEFVDHDIDIEYCEQVEEFCQESDIIKFRRLDAVPEALCVKCYGPYSRLYQHYVDAFAYIAQQGYRVAGAPRASYVDGCWNQQDEEKWLTVIQIPIER